VVTDPAGVAGDRIVVRTGERVVVVWTVPSDAAGAPWIVGCHIPGHLARGMQIPIRWVAAQGP
jgi:FtsP/CotA-like multicopper oxidase with cupredoxin domain